MSVEDIWSANYSIDSQSNNNEWTEKVTAAMREAVAEQERQSKANAGKISGSKAQQSAYAKFLIFLIEKIKSETLISILYNLFFTTKDPYHGTKYIRKSSNYPVIIGMFVPFFRDKIIEYKMQPLYENLYDPTMVINPTNYLIYLKKLAHAMHDNIALDQQLLVECIMEIYKEFNIIDMKAITNDQYEQIHSLIQKELY